MDELLSTLNGPQRRSVEHPPNVPLQILAGPGSGKTKVLTTRIAYLILRHAIAPSTICAVTFTNKAANEMKLRLTKLIGKEKVMRLKMGTFHALCARFLRQHAAQVGLEGNFTICDAEESKKLVGKIVKTHKDFIIAHKIMIDDCKEIVSKISKAKTKGYEPDDMVAILLDDLKGKTIPHKSLAILKDLDPAGWLLVEVYREYERTLRATNSLDFEDLLLWGVKLFGKHKQAVSWCKHILVDEFQDTNLVQYDLMRCIADANRCVTIVGDPDQSIYGWRSADIGNLKNMQRDFPSTKQIFLEQNYRSTASILALSLGIISGDDTRIKKTLHTAHPPGPRPMIHKFVDEKMEAQFIGTEMKRVVAATGGMLDWNDFAILLRFSALSREIEASLQREGIPYRMLGGHKFFERLEVKDILAYLQLVDNPRYLPAFMRTINLPSRNIGEKSITQVIQRAEQAGLSPLALVERIHDSKVPDIKPSLKSRVGSFVITLRTLRDQANSGTSPAILIRNLLDLIKYCDHLKKSHEDWESRMENIVELINFASQEKETALDAPPTDAARDPVDDHRATQLGDEGLVIIEDNSRSGMNQSTDADDNTDNETPLRQFLQASMLSTDSQTKDDDKKDKVTISTCHAAKGLEWPVVMVPAVENKVFPHKRSNDHAEERRLLYVACTRAKGLLYLGHVVERMVGGAATARDESYFVSDALWKSEALATPNIPDLTQGQVDIIARVIDRPPPEEDEVISRMNEFNRSGARERHSQTILSEIPLIPIDAPPARPVPWKIPGQSSKSQTKSVSNNPSSSRTAVPPSVPVITAFGSSRIGMGSVPPPPPPHCIARENRPPKPLQRPTPILQHPAPILQHPVPMVESNSDRASQGFERHNPSTSKAKTVHPAPSIPPLSSHPLQNHRPIQTEYRQTASPMAATPITQKQSYVTQHSLQAKSHPTSTSTSSSATVSAPTAPDVSTGAGAGTKRRLGMGRPSIGYPNKKFKAP